MNASNTCVTNVTEHPEWYNELQMNRANPFLYIQSLIHIVEMAQTPWILWSCTQEKWRIKSYEAWMGFIASIPSATVSIVIESEQQAHPNILKKAIHSDIYPVIWDKSWLLRQLRTMYWMPRSISYLGHELLSNLENTHLVHQISDQRSGLNKVSRDFFEPNRIERSFILPIIDSDPLKKMNPSTTPTVTILTTTYNEAPRIGWTIRSVMNQTFSDWELLVLDDGSTDHTSQVLSTFPDDRVIYIKYKENRGKVHVLNEGLQMARGTFLLELDADDFLPPHALQTFLEAIQLVETKKVALFSSAYHVWSENRQGDLRYKGMIEPATAFHVGLEHATPIIPRIYNTVLLKSIGGWPVLGNEFGRIFEDIAVCDRLLRTYRMKVLKEPLYHRVIRSNSISQTAKLRYRDWARKWLNQGGITI